MCLKQTKMSQKLGQFPKTNKNMGGKDSISPNHTHFAYWMFPSKYIETEYLLQLQQMLQ